MLWQLWSPTWRFDEATFERSAAAFDNPDFVDVVIHSYRHRFGLVPGDPAVAGIEAALALQPPITVPALTFDSGDDGVRPPASASQHGHRFTAARTHVVVPGVGRDARIGNCGGGCVVATVSWLLPEPYALAPTRGFLVVCWLGDFR